MAAVHHFHHTPCDENFMTCIPESDYISGQTVLCTGGLTGI